MKKIYIVLIIFLGTTLSLFALVDIFTVQNDISRNDKVIEKLLKDKNIDAREIIDMETRINKIKNDPASLQPTLIQKFKLLKKDQYIVNEANH